MKANMQQIVRPMKIMIRFALMLSFISMCSPKMREDPAKEDGVAQDIPAAEVTARQKAAGDIPPRSETDISKGRNIFRETTQVTTLLIKFVIIPAMKIPTMTRSTGETFTKTGLRKEIR